MDDPNKKQNDPARTGQSGQNQPGQQERRNPEDISQKQPSKRDDDAEDQEQGGQRKAS